MTADDPRHLTAHEVATGHPPRCDDDALAGVGTATRLHIAMSNADLCAHGFHAFVPWLQVESSWVTWCVRDGCGHKEQWDL